MTRMPYRAALAAVALALCCAATASASTPVDVFPTPGSGYEMPQAQIAFRGIPAAQIGAVTVVGSKSGPHAGAIKPDSDGDGGSFLPAKPFSAGETVTVTTGLNLNGAPSGKFTFRIASPGPPLKAERLPRAPVGSNGIQRFHSAPSLQPPNLRVTENRVPASEGDFFLAPQFGPTQNGPMILNSRGQVVWFHPAPIRDGQLMTDFRVQQLHGKPVLTWWQGVTSNGSGRGKALIFNQQYQWQQTVQAADGLQMDLHEFMVTNGGVAYFIAVEPVWLPGVHRPVQNGVVQAVDISTGLLEFEWDALDHVPLSQSIMYGPKMSGHVLDPYHLNSVALTPDGHLLVSARNTSAVYELDPNTGATVWTLGGRGSTFKMGPGATFALQHDAVEQGDGTITIFDDGAGPPRIHNASRGIRLALNTSSRTATLVHQFPHSPGILADFEGSTQLLGDGNVMVGWGQQPYFSENNSTGRQVFDAHFLSPTSSYRAYRFPWSAQPPTAPSIAVSPGSDGTTSVYASWNGATTVARWQVLSGPSARSLTVSASKADTGFETGLTIGDGNPYFQVQALDPNGHVLASSAVKHLGARVTFYGRSAFVHSDAMGAVPVGCLNGSACRVTTTVSSGRRVLARTGPERIGAGSAGLVYFRLSPSAAAALARSGRQRVTVSTSAAGTHARASTAITLVHVRAGAGGGHKLSHRGPLSLLGATDYVSGKGVGGILAQCQSAQPCRAKAVITTGHTTIATTGTERMGPREAGYFSFALNAAGKALLARAHGQPIGASVSLTGTGVSAAGSIVLDSF